MINIKFTAGVYAALKAEADRTNTSIRAVICKIVREWVDNQK